jgi:hypothetical protein
MTKDDWTNLALKLLGIYILIIYGGAFVAQFFAACAVHMNENGAMYRGFFTWQGPLSSLFVLLAGTVLIWKTEKITTLIWKK